MTLTIAIPCIDEQIYVNNVICVGNLISELKSQIVKIQFERNYSTYEQAESMLLTNWSNNSAHSDLFLLIRPDMCFTEKDILNMINLRSEAVFANYSDINGGSTAMKTQQGELLTAPLGCVLLRKNVVIKIQKLLVKDNHAQNITFINNEEVTPFFKHRMALKIDQSNTKPSTMWMDDSYSFSWLVRQSGIPITGYQSDTLGKVIKRPTRKKCTHSTGFNGYKNIKPRVINRFITSDINVSEPKQVVIENEQKQYRAPNYHPVRDVEIPKQKQY